MSTEAIDNTVTCVSEAAQRDHSAALELYEVVDSISDAHPRIADNIAAEAERLLRANELRREGAQAVIDAINQGRPDLASATDG